MKHRQHTNMRRLAQRLTPNQYSAPPVGATVIPLEPYIHNEWDDTPGAAAAAASSSSSYNNSINDLSFNHRRKSVPPFAISAASRKSEVELELVHKKNDAATKPPREPLLKALLPYPLRRTSAMSMLHGGIRVTGLNMPFPDLAVTKSEELTLPTLHEERRDLRWDAADSGLQLIPNNMHPQLRMQAWHNRCVDLQNRLKKEMKDYERKIYFHKQQQQQQHNSSKNSSSCSSFIVFKKNTRYAQPHSSKLRIEPLSDEEWQQKRSESLEAESFSAEQRLQPPAYTQKDAFMPFQSWKPHALGAQPVAVRGGASRPASAELHQERLNRKGYGWKSMQRSLWQQDRDTYRYTPDRGF